VHPDGSELLPFSAGAHLHLQLKPDLIRQYSLCNDPVERHRYAIAVLIEQKGRGGSKYMASSVREGDLIRVSAPVNHFPLAGREANFHLLLAGGIGVTPMMAMIGELQRRGSRFVMHYCARSPAKAAFLDRLKPVIEAGKALLHYDGGDPSKGLDIAAILSDFTPGMHLYACGPAGFMQCVTKSVGSWPPHTVHQEFFTAREMTAEEKVWDYKPFKVRIASTGAIIDVPAQVSIVEALRKHGIRVQTDCEDGHCGTCVTRFVEGEPVHRDTVLDDEGRKYYVMICCARAKSDVVVLDL
jgi:vanillate O-demethylase ferredoxin subunit